VGKPERRRPLVRVGVDGQRILKWIFESFDGSMDWIDLAQDRDMWRGLVNMIMNFRVP
jgi:hypothetical protein